MREAGGRFCKRWVDFVIFELGDQILFQLFQRKKEESASKTESVASKRNSQFKVVAKRDSVLLPDQGHSGGWVNRQQERADAVKEGSEWRSKAFSIV